MSESNTNLHTLLDEYEKEKKEISKQIEKLSNKQSSLFGTLFASFSKEFFVLVPEVKSVSWSQYTPYFNDGDACYFSMNDVSFANFIPDSPTSYLSDEYDVEEEGEDVKWAYLEYSLAEAKVLSPDKLAVCAKFDSFLSSNYGELETMFGDHVVVQITANGVETTECSHD